MILEANGTDTPNGWTETPVTSSPSRKNADRLTTGETLRPGDPPLKSPNGEYSLAWKGDDLTITSKDGREIWSVPTHSANCRVALSPGGSFDIVMDSEGVVTLWSDQENFSDFGDMRLEDNGALAKYDKNGKFLSYASRKDDKKTRIITVKLFLTPGRSAMLDMVIRSSQNAMQDEIDLLGSGKPSQAHKIAELYSTFISLDKTQAAFVQPYEELSSHVKTLTDGLMEWADKIESARKGAAKTLKKVIPKIEAALDSLDKKLRAPQVGTIGEDGKQVYKLDPKTDTDLIDAVRDTVHTVDELIRHIADWATETSDELDHDPNNNGEDYLNSVVPGIPPGGPTYGQTDQILASYGLGGATTGGSQSTSTDQQEQAQVISALTALARNNITNTQPESKDDSNALQQMMLASMMGNQGLGVNDRKKKHRSTGHDDEHPTESSNQPQPQPQPQPQTETPIETSPNAPTPPPTTTSAPSKPSPPKVDLVVNGVDLGETSSTVYAAVQNGLNNPNASDAEAAYTGTPGQNTTDHPWNVVEDRLRTGDVAVWEQRTGDDSPWERHTAIIVFKGDEAQLIRSGGMVKLDDALRPDDGHGTKINILPFMRPSGIQEPAPSAAAPRPSTAT